MLSGDPSDRRMTAQMAAVVLCVALALSAAVALPEAPAASGSPSARRVVLLGLRQRGNPARLASLVSDPGSRSYRRFSVAASVPGSILGARVRPHGGPALSPLAGRRRHRAAELGPVDRAGCSHRPGRAATVLRPQRRGAHARALCAAEPPALGARRYRRASSIPSAAALVTHARSWLGRSRRPLPGRAPARAGFARSPRVSYRPPTVSIRCVPAG